MDSTSLAAMARPLVAILRGIRPQEAHDIVAALIEEGFTAIEVPLNSPEPFRSIEIAAGLAPAGVLIGAGTVLDAEDVARLDQAGGRLVVTPNVDRDVLGAATARGMATMPGVFTPTEALAAVRWGASALKFFPASVLGPSGITAIRAVLPAKMPVGAVGGISDADFASYAAHGIRIFGLGSSLYRPGDPVAKVRENAARSVAAFDRVFGAA